jgi:nicotinate-nucleotide adenylyltransferase
VYRLGIIGGTFDPIHYGHLVAAETARTEFALNKVLFVPTGISPHKINQKITSPELRYKMVEAAIRDNPDFSLSRLEIERQGPSYTVDTLRELQRLYPEWELYFITGTDALREIFDWYQVDQVLNLTKFIAASRPGYKAQDFLLKIRTENPRFLDRINLLEVPALAISSTDIRSRVAKGQSIRYLLPEDVRVLIEKAKLYLS